MPGSEGGTDRIRATGSLGERRGLPELVTQWPPQTHSGKILSIKLSSLIGPFPSFRNPSTGRLAVESPSRGLETAPAPSGCPQASAKTLAARQAEVKLFQQWTLSSVRSRGEAQTLPSEPRDVRLHDCPGHDGRVDSQSP